MNDDQTILVTDYGNHRIIEWKCGATYGNLVAGENKEGNKMNQLCYPTDAIVDRETDSVIICDNGNQRVMRWPRRNGTTGEIILDNIDCEGVVMDDQRRLYISIGNKHEVRRYRVGDTHGELVAGGNGQGDALNQLNSPSYMFVDRHYSVYVSDRDNHRVVQWTKDAKEGIIVAGSQGEGNDLTQMCRPRGLFIDMLGTVYVADSWNSRVMRWCQEAVEGTIIVGENDVGEQGNQLNVPVGLSFDQLGNFYVVDCNNHRVQRFLIMRSPQVSLTVMLSGCQAETRNNSLNDNWNW